MTKYTVNIPAENAERIIFQFLNAAYAEAFKGKLFKPEKGRAVSLMAAELSQKPDHSIQSLAAWAKENV